MKRLILALLVLGFVHSGCQDDPTGTGDPDSNTMASVTYEVHTSDVCDSTTRVEMVEPRGLTLTGFLAGSCGSPTLEDWGAGEDSIVVELERWTDNRGCCCPCSGYRYEIFITDLTPGEYFFRARQRFRSVWSGNIVSSYEIWEGFVYVRP